MTPVGVAMTPVGVAMTPVRVVMTSVGVAIVPRAMTPVGVACRFEPMGLAMTPVGVAIVPRGLQSQSKHEGHLNAPLLASLFGNWAGSSPRAGHDSKRGGQ